MNPDKFYIVFRDDNRVSDTEHQSMESANVEADRWKKIIQQWPDGSKITVVERVRN